MNRGGGSVDPDVAPVPRQRRGRPRGTGIIIAGLSTLVVLSLVGFVVVNSDGWAVLQSTFFDAKIFWKSLPSVTRAFALNVQIFLIVEVLVLGFALLLAVLRSLPGPAFFPLRVLSIAYIDIFRGLPSVMVVYLLGLGIPALNLPGVTSDVFFWGIVTLTMLWSAYVAEVYRAGIESVHPSQDAAARSLGLSRFQSLRYVVLPQAVRRVIPPLLNDFIGLQKDSALVGFLGPVEAFRRAQIDVAATFNFTPYLAAAVIFLAVTVPLTRFVDWLITRNRRQRLAGAT
jgi:polar amino acid transport system permease protein